MATQRDAQHTAVAVQNSVGAYVRRLRQLPLDGDLSLPARSALRWLDRGGSTTASALAKLEQISPQSMGATIAELESRGLLVRSPDPEDGRRSLLSITAEGAAILRSRRDARIVQLTQVLRTHFTDDELDQLAAAAPLIERLAESLQ